MSCIVFYSTYPHAEDGEPGMVWSVDAARWTAAELDQMVSSPMMGPSDCIFFAPFGDPAEWAADAPKGRSTLWIVRSARPGGMCFACAAASARAAERLFGMERPREPVASVTAASPEEAMAAILTEITAFREAGRNGDVTIPGAGKGHNGVLTRAREILGERVSLMLEAA